MVGTAVGFLDMTEPRPQYRKKKQALRDIEAKGITLDKAFELGAEETIIERQLGFLPTNVHSVAARAGPGAVRQQWMPLFKICSSCLVIFSLSSLGI